MFVLENAPASPLSASGLSVLPLSGAAPLAVTATTAATGGTGSGRLYTFTWDDGETTGPQSGSTATHTYDTAGSYDVTYTVTES
jgi:PKD repeat protein